MPGLVGHIRAQMMLMPPAELPPATLLIGPDGVGKMLLARTIARARKYHEEDIFSSGKLTTDVAADLLSFASRAATGPAGRMVILCLDGSAAYVQDVLLKTLEEPPPGTKFLLTASQPPLPTIVSRCQIVRCGPLSTDDVEKVLLRLGLPAKAARTAAVMSGGSPGAALELSSAEVTDALDVVGKALKAVSARKPAQLRPLFRSMEHPWGQEHHVLLGQWAAEAATFRWRVFSAATAPGISRAHAKYLLQMLASLGSASPRLADRTALEMIAVQERR